jgi:hypothetical protein
VRSSAVIPCVALSLMASGCLGQSSRTAQERPSYSMAAMAMDIRTHVADRRALNREMERLLDAFKELEETRIIFKRHPLFSKVRGKVLEGEAKALVEPKKKQMLAAESQAGMSEDEKMVLAKMIEIERQGEHFASEFRHFAKREAQLFNNKTSLLYRVDSERDAIAGSDQFQEIVSLMQQLNTEWKRQESLAKSMKMVVDAAERWDK